MEHFYKTIKHGACDFEELYSIAAKEFIGGHYVEIGSLHGQSAAFMAVELINHNPTAKFDVVDHFEGAPNIEFGWGADFLDVFLENTAPVKHMINVVQAWSVDAAKKYEDLSLDFVFIDASHDYESVRADIDAWLPKVRSGGWIAGHDYGDPGVTKAVDESFPEAEMFQPSTWLQRL